MSLDSSSTDKSLSCSDCRQELYERRWTHVLLNWINLCVLSGSLVKLVKEMSLRPLMAALSKYKEDIRALELDPVFICAEDIEPFLASNYPILRLWNLSSESDQNRKMYIMTSVLLFHCCVNSRTGAVASDICKNLNHRDQKLILKFCENLWEMEVTINNVDSAIAGAFKKTLVPFFEKKDNKSPNQKQVTISNNLEVASFQFESLGDSSSSSANLTFVSSNITPVVTFKSSSSVLPAIDSPAESSDASKYSDALSFFDGSKMTSSDFKSSEESNKISYCEDCKCPPKPRYDARTDEKACKCPPNPRNDARTDEKACKCPPNPRNDARTDEKACKCPPKQLNDARTDEKACKCPPKPLNDARTDEKGPETVKPYKIWLRKWRKIWIVIVAVFMFLLLSLMAAIIVQVIYFKKENKSSTQMVEMKNIQKRLIRTHNFRSTTSNNKMHWECRNNLCHKLYQPPSTTQCYSSLSRCILLCTGPQLWPYPVGEIYFSQEIVAISKTSLEYKFLPTPSLTVHQQVSAAFNLFLTSLAKLEKTGTSLNQTELSLNKLYIEIEVKHDPDPRLRLDTIESYALNINSADDQVNITITSASFCGVRHGLETLGQLILLDQTTGLLITLSRAIIKDAPSYKYRGLMIDTARNYIPVPDLMRTLDGMASCKLNTFHWRISDVTSFPLHLPDYPQLFELGGYDKSMVYTVENVKALVDRAAVRGIRVLIEIAAPGPVGRSWSWTPDTTCPTTKANLTWDNALCLRLKLTEAVLDVLEDIYSLIIEMTNVNDVFHLSDGVFSFIECHYLIEDREDFLEKALARLKRANKGFLPKLPIIWYTTHLSSDYDARSWEYFGVQLGPQESPFHQSLTKYRVIHSGRWDLSCETRHRQCWKYRTWQEMYAWKAWRKLPVSSTEGGEALLWTDLVDSSNLDAHLWPRAAAVAERLWSDIVANHSATGHEYLRLDAQRWRMLLRGIKVQPVWPVWCNLNPHQCLKKLL